jgi:hypothetical protein
MSAKITVTADSVEMAFLKVEMARRGMTVEDLSERVGWKWKSFVCEWSLAFPCAPLRWKVEQALDFLPIWSSGAQVRLRQRCHAAFGVDPKCAELSELQALCRRLGIHAPQVRRREAWEQQIFAWLAANPRSTPTK